MQANLLIDQRNTLSRLVSFSVDLEVKRDGKGGKNPAFGAGWLC